MLPNLNKKVDAYYNSSKLNPRPEKTEDQEQSLDAYSDLLDDTDNEASKGSILGALNMSTVDLIQVRIFYSLSRPQ